MIGMNIQENTMNFALMVNIHMEFLFLNDYLHWASF